MKIKLNGKEYGVHWGMGAIRMFCEVSGYDFEKGMACALGFDEYNVLERSKAVAMLIVSAIRNYAFLNNEDANDVTYQQIEAYRDSLPVESFQEIVDDFKASMFMGKSMAETFGLPAPETNSKKKVSPKASQKKS